MITLLKSGNVYDPQNKIFNVKKDIYIDDGQIIDKKSITSKIDKVIDCTYPKSGNKRIGIDIY